MGEVKDKPTKYVSSDYAVGGMELYDKKLLRRVDWQILPIMFLTYFLQFVDKISLNYANVMGLQDDLGMSANDFSWLATAFFIAYAAAEVPQGALLQRFPITKVLGVNVFFWGIFLCCSSAAQNYRSIMALGILLGIVEAVIAPALTMYTSMWYTRAESTPRYGFWYCGLGAGQIIGGIISFGAQHAPKEMAFNGWRIMLVVVGAVKILVSVLVFFVLSETPEKARFLTEPEKQRIALRLSQNQAGVGLKVFRWRSLLEVFGDLQTWLLVAILITIPSGVITTFSSILIKAFGYTSMESAFLNMPSGVVSILSTMLSTYAIAKGFSWCLAIVLLLIPTLLGSCLMSFFAAFEPSRTSGWNIYGEYLAPLALIFAWTGANFKGYTMKVSGCSIVSAGFSIANIIGPQTFQSRDAPQYISAKITIVAVNASAMIVAAILRIIYGLRIARANKSGTPARSLLEQRMASKAIVQDVHDDCDFRYVD